MQVTAAQRLLVPSDQVGAFELPLLEGEYRYISLDTLGAVSHCRMIAYHLLDTLDGDGEASKIAGACAGGHDGSRISAMIPPNTVNLKILSLHSLEKPSIPVLI